MGKEDDVMWAIAKKLWLWIFIIGVFILVIASDGINSLIVSFVVAVCVTGFIYAIYYSNKLYKQNNRVTVLGCRLKGDHQICQEQFRGECKKYSISAHKKYQIMICDYLREIERKGLHLELVKEDGIQYHPKEGGYLGSIKWRSNWSWIIFSPSITGGDFCKSVVTIMEAHDIKGHSEDIKEYDSYYTYEFLNLMRYNLIIKENDDSLKHFEVDSSDKLRERLKA